MNKVGDQSVSPYLLQRLRSLDEVKDEREQRQRELEAKDSPAPTPKAEAPAAAESSDPQDKRPGQRLNQSV